MTTKSKRAVAALTIGLLGLSLLACWGFTARMNDEMQLVGALNVGGVWAGVMFGKFTAHWLA